MEKLITSNIQSKYGIKEAILFSALLHIVGLFYATDISFDDFRVSQNQEESKPKPIKIKFRKDKTNVKAKQIVNSSKSNNKKKDPNAKFLGKHTQSFDRQTTAATTGRFKEAGVGVRDGQEKSIASSSKVQKKKGISKKNTKKIKFSDLSFGSLTPQKFSSATALGLKNGNADARGLSRNNDFIEEVPLGDMTSLNTVETKYYGFYHRIRLKLEQYWGDTLNKKVSSLYKRGRAIASEQNLITSLKIRLDAAGNITGILIKSTSGIQELDDAAIESFSKAGPFPNPPSGMLKQGQATIEWGFVVKG